jgi:acetyl esterase/lipase
MEAGKLLLAETEIILTHNVRQFLTDQKDTPSVQDWLRQFRSALQGDGKQVGSFFAALGVDPLKDVDRITAGFTLGDTRPLCVIVEGRFDADKFASAFTKLARQQWGSCSTRQVGERAVWQIPGGDGANVALLSGRTLAITRGKAAMDALLARASAREATPSAAMRKLLERGEKEHILFLIDHVDARVDAALDIVKAEVGKTMRPGDTLGKLILDQVTSQIQKYAHDVSAFCIGLSVGEEELRLQWGLVAKKPEVARELRGWVDRGNIWGSLALQGLNIDLARQLADILVHTRVVCKDTTLVVRAEIPYEFLATVLQQPWSRLSVGGLSLFQTLSRRVTSISLWGPVKPQPAGALEVEEVRDITYDGAAKPATFRQQLDLFVPKGKKDYPTVVVVHGGGWFIGDNRCCGLYTTLGHFLASQGIGAVLVNYRLSPAVKHPEHVKDVARAVRWAHDNMAKHGGSSERIFLLGHSAGAHLVALVATDESYLKAEGLSGADIKGVIAVSGVYQIPPRPVELTLGGSGPQAFHLEQVVPLRGESGWLPTIPLGGVPLKPNVFGMAFGDDPMDRANASPLSHLRRGLPPFLIVNAENDLPSLPAMAEDFQRALVRQGCSARLLQVRKRNHNSVLFSAITPEDPTARAILEFVRQEKKP